MTNPQPSKFKKYAFKILIAFLILHTAVLTLGYFIQERFIFFPTVLDPQFQYQFKHPFIEHHFQSSDLNINALQIPEQESKGYILYFHGNAQALDNWGKVAIDLAENTNWDVWVVDYPGFGKSEGHTSSQKQLLQFADDFKNYVSKHYPPNTKKVTYGRSLGTGLAVYLGQNDQYDGVILETPYDSILNVAQDLFPMVPGFLIKYPMPSDVWIQSIQKPILILQGTDDQVIPISHARNLATKTKNVIFKEFPGLGHNNLRDSEEFWPAVQEYLNRL